MAKRRRHSRPSKQLLLVLLFSLACILFSYAMYGINARQDSGFSVGSGNFVITDLNSLPSESAILGEGWIFVPNIDYSDIDNGSFEYEDYIYVPHADNVSISPSNGWENLGPNATWQNCDGEPVFKLYERDGKHKITALYMSTVHFNTPEATYHLNIPEANGLVVVYCNGVKLGTMWNRVDEWTSSLGFGYGHVPIIPDENGDAKLIIAVSASETLYNPGILGLPSIADAGDSYKFVVVPTLWYAIQVTLFFFLLVGGLLISRTYKHKSSVYLLIIIELFVLAYTFVDCHFITQTSVIREVTKYVTLIIISIFTFLFMNAILRSSSNDGKGTVINKILPAIVTIVGLSFIVIVVFNQDVLGTNFPHITGIVFSIAVYVISIILMISIYNHGGNIIFGSTALTCYVLFFFNVYAIPSGIYDVPSYSFSFIIVNLVVEIYYIVRYVIQSRELEDTNKRMQHLVKEKTQHISEINRDLFNTNKRLMENEAARKNVLSNVSHDLRTPITAIRGYAELLLATGEKMNDTQRKNYLSNIIKRATQMEQIISDIVELTRLESNSNEFQFTDVSISELLDEICMMYESDLEHTKKCLSLSIPDTDPLIVRADPKKISRVFENLISNAINYTFEEAEITVKAWREGDSKDLSSQVVKIDIIDNGIGIPENEIANIFDRFYRAKNSGQNIKGTGIGLSIVKTIIDHHDAQITVESTIGTGTIFHITMKATYN
ncbi:MAG: ATP-binding protein [Saccharofermentans sp.]|nr:ATP-binding protein [Saccharofermentans sp.]